MTDTEKLERIVEASLKLNTYLLAGGMLSVPSDSAPFWELGRNLGHAYCIDGQGDMFLDCLLSVSPHVWDEVCEH